MTDQPDDIPITGKAEAEALAWLRLITSGRATQADAEALEQWRGENSEHARAFSEASLMWNAAGEAARDALRRDPSLASVGPSKSGNIRVSRRVLAAGGAALAASIAAGLAVRPPLDLWPSLSALGADYRTGPGERRRFEVASSVAVDMNTRTSLDVRHTAGGSEEIELIAGEVAFTKTGDIARDVVVRAGTTVTRASRASFSIRHGENAVRIICIDGKVRVEGGGRAATLSSGEAIACDDQGLGVIGAADSETTLAWQRGLLVFQSVPLRTVIDEINRYRAGRIVLIDGKLADRQVIANFQIDRLEAAIDFVTEVFRVPARRLPGGIVLLG